MQEEVVTSAEFLVLATENRLSKVVQFLLDISANKPLLDIKPAAFKACGRGYHEILKILLDHKKVGDLKVNVGEKNMLHEVCSNFGMVSEKQDIHKCFNILIEYSKDNEIDVNQQDTFKFTPLYYAILHKNDEATKVLLRKAYVGQRNMFKQTQIYHITKEVFEEFFVNQS